MNCILKALLVFALHQGVHDNHTSIVDVQYNSSTQSIEIIHSIFYDDLELAISRSTGNQNFDISQTSASNEKIIQAYILKNFEVDLAGSEVKWLGYEIQDYKLNVYLEVPVGREQLFNFEITDMILFDLYKNQKHIIRYRCKDRVVGRILDAYKHTCQMQSC